MRQDFINRASLEQFGLNLRRLNPSQQRGVPLQILKQAAGPIQARMAELAPHDPVEGQPDLKDSIVVAAVRKVEDEDFGGMAELGESVVAVAIGPSKDAFHGFFQEYGTAPHGKHPGNPPQPFARPAFDERKDWALKAIAEGIWAFIVKVSAGNRSTQGRGL